MTGLWLSPSVSTSQISIKCQASQGAQMTILALARQRRPRGCCPTGKGSMCLTQLCQAITRFSRSIWKRHTRWVFWVGIPPAMAILTPLISRGAPEKSGLKAHTQHREIKIKWPKITSRGRMFKWGRTYLSLSKKMKNWTSSTKRCNKWFLRRMLKFWSWKKNL